MPDLGIPRENIVFISGIGCSSRFPYYMNTLECILYMEELLLLLERLKATRPDLSVWLITGDGDALSIGGNHSHPLFFEEILISIYYFNNQIYGLTKGQYSPTSELGKKTKSTPTGSIDHPFNPLHCVCGADATFIARTIDREPKHLKEILMRAEKHQGTSLVEIYQNCNIFNDGAFIEFTDNKIKKENTLFLKHGEPLIFGPKEEKGIILDGFQVQIVNLVDGSYTKDDLWIHDEKDRNKANILTRFFDDPSQDKALPRPFGVFYQEDRFCYEKALADQESYEKQNNPSSDIDDLLAGFNTWEVPIFSILIL